MKTLLAAPLALVAVVAMTPAHAQDRDTLFQMSTLAALQQGVYQPAISIGELHRHGDFGLGTFEGLDGEMVINDGTVFQVPFSGVGRVAKDRQQSPFAVVTFFETDQRYRVRRTVDLDDLQRTLDRRVGSLNYFYAMKVTGTFDHVKTRSVPKQAKPYVPLATVIGGQRTFDLRGVEGTLVGIRSPNYVGSMNVPGYHWHFISANGKRGGHVLELSADRLTVQVDETRNWHVALPKNKAFRAAELG